MPLRRGAVVRRARLFPGGGTSEAGRSRSARLSQRTGASCSCVALACMGTDRQSSVLPLRRSASAGARSGDPQGLLATTRDEQDREQWNFAHRRRVAPCTRYSFNAAASIGAAARTAQRRRPRLDDGGVLSGSADGSPGSLKSPHPGDDADAINFLDGTGSRGPRSTGSGRPWVRGRAGTCSWSEQSNELASAPATRISSRASRPNSASRQPSTAGAASCTGAPGPHSSGIRLYNPSPRLKTPASTLAGRGPPAPPAWPRRQQPINR